jgi:monofunctional biosynthetic peptidoglycan transglycosylase
MAGRKKQKAKGLRARMRGGIAWIWRWSRRLILGAVGFVLLWVLAYRWIDPPTTPYIVSEAIRLDQVDRTWVDIEDVAPVMARAAVAAEDANFCNHWGLDVGAIRDALEDGSGRGASTISQQVVKNTFLWHGRSWFRKAAEAILTPVMESLWPKRRILEVYLNIAEMGEGVFGVQAAAQHYFGVDAADLTDVQAARIAASLPSPKTRNPAQPTSFLRRRAASIIDGAATIRADGRAACFED